MTDRQILKRFHDIMTKVLNEYKRSQINGKQHLKYISHLLIMIDQYAVAQYLYTKGIPLISVGYVDYMTNIFIQQHRLMYKNHIIPINYKKTIHNLDSVVDGLYPSTPIFFRGKNDPSPITLKEYNQGNYKNLIQNVLALKNHKKHTGYYVINALHYLRILTNLDDHKVFKMVFSIKPRVQKSYARRHVPKNIDNDQRSQTVKKYYYRGIARWIENHFTSHQAYIIILKIMCNDDVEIHF